jgi:hypothetical protein
MKHGGKKRGSLPEKTVPIGEFTFRVKGLAFGTMEEMGKGLPRPTPPLEFARDRKGKILRDKEGKVVKHSNTEDADYKTEVRRVNLLESAIMIHEGLRADPEIEWETPQELKDQDKTKFAESILQELKEFPLTTGEIILLQKAISEVSGLQKEQLERAMEDLAGEGE